MKNQFGNMQFIWRALWMIILYASCSTAVQAQNNALKANYFGLGKASFSYERALTTKSSLSLSYKINKERLKFNGLFSQAQFTNNGQRLSAEYRWYYAANNGKKLNGFYLAPNAAVGSHRLTYTHTNKPGFGFGLIATGLNLAASVVTQTDLVNREVQRTSGKTEVAVADFGLKVGWQKRFKRLTLDLGVNCSNNMVLGQSEGIPLSDGGYKSLPKGINGTRVAGYLGLGLAF